MATKLTARENAGLKAILNWGVDNFHKLKEDNKIKMWMKVYDKTAPDKVDVAVSLSEAVKAARLRAESRRY
jgi:hypothetical protein